MAGAQRAPAAADERVVAMRFERVEHLAACVGALRLENESKRLERIAVLGRGRVDPRLELLELGVEIANRSELRADPGPPVLQPADRLRQHAFAERERRPQ